MKYRNQEDKAIFDAAFDIGVDAVQRCQDEIGDGEHKVRDSMAGLLCSVVEALYALAPSHDMASVFIEVAKKEALDAKDERSSLQTLH
jgi:hypothetical protein